MSSQKSTIKRRIDSVESRIEELNKKIDELRENVEICKSKKRKYEEELDLFENNDELEKKILICVETHCSYGIFDFNFFEFVGKIPEILLTHDITYKYNERKTIFDAESEIENVCNDKMDDTLKEIKNVVNSNKFKSDVLKLRYSATHIQEPTEPYIKNEDFVARIRFIIKLNYDIYYS